MQIGHQLVLTSRKEGQKGREEGEDLNVGEEGWCGAVLLSLLSRLERLVGGGREELGVLCEVGRELVRVSPLSLLISLDKQTLDWLGRQLKKGGEDRGVIEKLTQISVYSTFLGVEKGKRRLCFSIFQLVSVDFLESLFEELEGGEDEGKIPLLVAFCLFFHWKVIEGEVGDKGKEREGGLSRNMNTKGWKEAEEVQKVQEMLRKCFEGERGKRYSQAKLLVNQVN